MSDQYKLNVVICWHMHQPQYANSLNGQYQLPWTYLHAIKDYTDMAAHLEAEPKARAVVNFAPILLEQISDYAEQIDSFLKSGREIRDTLLCALGSAVLPVDVQQRTALISACLKANEERLINRFKPFKHLAEMGEWFTQHPSANIYINDQFLVDIVVWYHLAWLGETIRRNDQRIKNLISKQAGYTFRDRRLLMQVIGELLSGIIGRYKALSDSGQVELSVTPYAHPIVPLLLDFQSAKQAMPDVSLPLLDHYPGGQQRVNWHIEKGLQVFEQHFGFRPRGCWPSEGGVSTESVSYYEQAGFHWLASGETVIRNSLNQIGESGSSIHGPFAIGESNTACFFRDDGLSDLIGFTYSSWHADDAVANLVQNLENIADNAEEKAHEKVVSIILDGENAWEYYPYNGYYFLSTLYTRLAEHDKINLTTFGQCLDKNVPWHRLEKYVAGSWVYGSFSTWIGDPDKNRAWDMLGDAKNCFDQVMMTNDLSDEQIHTAEKQLAICEGSDWFWWFGDYNPAGAVSDFDRLYRLQLVNLYQILGEEPPEYLSHVFAHGSGRPQHGGVMRANIECI